MQQSTVSVPQTILNGNPTNRTKAKVKKSPAERSPVSVSHTATFRIRVWATTAMGVFIPLLSLGLSYTAGNLLKVEQYGLATFAITLMGCVLAVSLSHLAWGIGDITRSTPVMSWLLALSFDLCLVLGELCHVNAEEAGVGGVVTAIMVCVCGLSMFLNVWAFLRHKAPQG